MAQLELWHIVMVVAGLLGFLGSIYLYHVVAIHWETITLVVRASFRRFLTVPSRQEFLARLADERPDHYVDDDFDEVVSRDTNTDIDTVQDFKAVCVAFGNLTQRERVQVIASLKSADKWAWTGNKIYSMVGGDRNEVLGWIQEVRNTPEPDARFPESTKDGRPVASHLKVRA